MTAASASDNALANYLAASKRAQEATKRLADLLRDRPVGGQGDQNHPGTTK